MQTELAGKEFGLIPGTLSQLNAIFAAYPKIDAVTL